MIYKPAKGSRLTDEQAQRYGDRIYSIIEERDGIVTPEDVVQDASSPESPLHDYFEWDNDAAAEKWRDTQARYLLRSIKVVIERDETEEEMRSFYNVQRVPEERPDDKHIYVAVQRLSETEIYQQVLAEALKQLELLREKYGRLTELQAVFAAIDAVLG